MHVSLPIDFLKASITFFSQKTKFEFSNFVKCWFYLTLWTYVVLKYLHKKTEQEVCRIEKTLSLEAVYQGYQYKRCIQSE